MGESPVRFGILGCAMIAQKLSVAITLSPNATLHALGSRSIEKAIKYASDNGYPPSTKIYASYEEVINDPEVEAVYMPLPTSLHLKWALLAAQKKKHVLIEKPVALNVGEFDQIVEACHSNGVQLMDGTMWMHHPRTAKMREFLDDENQFGQLKSVHTVLSFRGDPDFFKNNIRVKPDLDALGALGDLGWYCTRAILWAANYKLPKTVTATRGPVVNASRVILACGASFQWEDGKIATFHCSFETNLTMDVTVMGTLGTLHINDFIIPFQEDSATFSSGSKTGFTMTGWNPLPNDHTVITDIPQEVCMVTEFARLVRNITDSGSKPDSKWTTMSRKTQLMLDAVKASIDRGFEPVEVVS